MFDLYYDVVVLESMSQERDKTGSLKPLKPAENITCRRVSMPEDLILNRDSEAVNVRNAYHTKADVKVGDYLDGRLVQSVERVADVFGVYVYTIVYTE